MVVVVVVLVVVWVQSVAVLVVVLGVLLAAVSRVQGREVKGPSPSLQAPCVRHSARGWPLWKGKVDGEGESERGREGVEMLQVNVNVNEPRRGGKEREGQLLFFVSGWLCDSYVPQPVGAQQEREKVLAKNQI